jgi:hypothetical protein
LELSGKTGRPPVLEIEWSGFGNWRRDAAVTGRRGVLFVAPRREERRMKAGKTGAFLPRHPKLVGGGADRCTRGTCAPQSKRHRAKGGAGRTAGRPGPPARCCGAIKRSRSPSNYGFAARRSLAFAMTAKASAT